MKINESMITHYQCIEIPIEILKTMVNLNEKHLKEKPTWYIIDNKLQFFKPRNDLRIFSELLYNKIGNYVGLEMLEYQLVSVQITNGKNKPRNLGLISQNFQKEGFNYYLIEELQNPEISDLKSYGGYNLIDLFKFFKGILNEKNYDEIKKFFITLFITDGFLMESDRNYNNIGFEIVKIDGISYKQRLRPHLLLKNNEDSKNYINFNSDNSPKIIGLNPTPVMDSEHSLGINKKTNCCNNGITNCPNGKIWQPALPINNLLLFDNQEQAKKTSQELYYGLDPNLVELYMNFYDESKELFYKFAYDDFYQKILENFDNKSNSIYLAQPYIKHFKNILGERQKQYQKILKL